MLLVHRRRVKAALHERVDLGRIKATIHVTRHSGGGVEATRHGRRIRERDRSGERHNGDKTEDARCDLSHTNLLATDEFGAERGFVSNGHITPRG
jgi:hypothetical protein